MKLDDFFDREAAWLKGDGPKANIAISTRVRIARNIEGHLYFSRADSSEKEKTLEYIFEGLKKSGFFKRSLFVRIKEISDLDKSFLVERHLMSREHAQDVAFKGLVVDENEVLSAMINEEDHVRLQVMQPGLNIMDTWRIVDEVESDMSKSLSFDFSNKFGYLTSCPTNTGTGLRASVMLHLSALVMTGQIESVFDAISKLGLTMRGFYGEGTDSLGDFFQISNQVALGHSELDILDNLERIINKIVAREESTRQKLLSKRRAEISDGIFRSYGTLKSAEIITSSETIKLLSAVRLGTDLGLIKDINADKINEVLLFTRPAHLQKKVGRNIAPYERDIKRADLIREMLGVKEG